MAKSYAFTQRETSDQRPNMTPSELSDAIAQVNGRLIARSNELTRTSAVLSRQSQEVFTALDTIRADVRELMDEIRADAAAFNDRLPDPEGDDGV